MPWLGPVVALVGSLLGGPPQEALVGRGPAIRWSAPSECPDEARVADAVARYVGRPLLEDEAVQARATVRRTREGRFAVDLWLVGPGGAAEPRTFEDAACAVLAEGAALVIAAAIDPRATARIGLPPEPPEGPPGGVVSGSGSTAAPGSAWVAVAQARRVEPLRSPPQPPATTAAPHDPATPPRSCRAGPRRPGDGPRGQPCVGLAARVALQWGPLPRAGPGVGGDASLSWPRLRLEAGGTFLTARPARVDAAGAVGGDVRLGVGHARGCARLAAGVLEVPLCGGLEAGALRGIGVGIVNPRSARLGWLGALADAGVSWAPGRRIALRAQAGVVMPLVAHRFAIGGVGVVHEPAPVGLRAALAAEVWLP